MKMNEAETSHEHFKYENKYIFLFEVLLSH